MEGAAIISPLAFAPSSSSVLRLPPLTACLERSDHFGRIVIIHSRLFHVNQVTQVILFNQVTPLSFKSPSLLLFIAKHHGRRRKQTRNVAPLAYLEDGQANVL
jgi:hypothetical protein